jgi:hypothetical protein
MLKKSGSDASAAERRVGGELTEQDARDWVWRLACSDRARHDGGYDTGRGQSIVTYDAIVVCYDHDDREALLLVGKSPRLEPVIEGRLAA